MKDLLLRSEFYESVDYIRLILGLVLLIFLVLSLSQVYIKYSQSPTNRKSFASIFILFAVSIFLIVYTIKSSLALSLGMVGALSIIRFRTAIKEPEQIVYFLAVTAMAIAIAAEKEIIAILVTFVFIAAVLIRHRSDKNVNNRFAHLLLSLKVPSGVESTKILSELLSANDAAKLFYKNLFEDSNGNMRITFSLADDTSFEQLKLKEVLKNNGIEDFNLSLIHI